MNPIPTLNGPSDTPDLGAVSCVVREVLALVPGDVQTSARLVSLAVNFQSAVRLVVEGQSYATKSMIDVLAAGLNDRKPVTLIAEGPDAEEAVSALERFLTRKPLAAVSERERSSRLCEMGAEHSLQRVA